MNSVWRIVACVVLPLLSGWISASERAATAWQWLDQGAVLIDVRTAEEFETENIEGAINLPLKTIREQITNLEINQDQPIVLYCRSGRRSGLAQAALTELGYTQVHNGGGLTELQKMRPQQ